MLAFLAWCEYQVYYPSQVTDLHEFHGDQLEALLFKTLDDFTNETTLDAIGLDHDESALVVRHVCGLNCFVT